MKAKIFYFFLILTLLSCKKEVQITQNEWVEISQRVQYLEGKEEIQIKSGKFTYSIKKSKLPFKKVVLLNSSLTGYFIELDMISALAGVSSPEYVFSDSIRTKIEDKTIANIGNEQKYNIEKIIALKPDAIFTNYVESFENTYEVLRKSGIELIFIDDYLEQEPLGKSRILELFGLLLGNKDAAIKRYEQIEKNYKDWMHVAAEQNTKPMVLTNEMYGNQWFLPGGKSYVAQLIKDANANYILQDNAQEISIPLSFEEVYVKAKDAQFWVNLGYHDTKMSMLAINPNYAKMEVFNKGKLFTVEGSVKGKANDYFESGVVRSDLVLRDYIKIFYPNLFPDQQLKYLKELN